MDENYKKDIRFLLKSFGVMTDEAIVEHIINNPNILELDLQLILQDNTNYEDKSIKKLSLEVSKKIICK